MLIPPLQTKGWGEKRNGNKVDMLGELIGYPPEINRNVDNPCMEQYLRGVSKMDWIVPLFYPRNNSLTAEAPLLDFMVEEVKKKDGSKYPKLEDLQDYQLHRGLSLEMMEKVEVKELVCGVSSEEEIKIVRDWILEMHGRDQEKFGTQVVSLDVEDVKTTFYDTLRISGKARIDPENLLSCIGEMMGSFMVNPRIQWNQIPGKIMFCNGVSWMCVILLDLKFNKRKE